MRRVTSALLAMLWLNVLAASEGKPTRPFTPGESYYYFVHSQDGTTKRYEDRSSYGYKETLNYVKALRKRGYINNRKDHSCFNDDRPSVNFISNRLNILNDYDWIEYDILVLSQFFTHQVAKFKSELRTVQTNDVVSVEYRIRHFPVMGETISTCWKCLYFPGDEKSCVDRKIFSVHFERGDNLNGL